MQITITQPAVQWFKESMMPGAGEAVRFFVRYGGCSTVQQGFSLGVTVQEPKDPGVEAVVGGLHFYIEKEDLWYFQDTDLIVKYIPEMDEILFDYEK